MELKEKNIQFGNTAKNGIKTVTDAGGRVKELGQNISRNVQNGDSPEAGTANTAKEGANQAQKDTRKTLNNVKNKTKNQIKKHTQSELKTKYNGNTGKTVNNAADNAAKTVKDGIYKAEKGGLKTGKWAANASAKMDTWATSQTAKITNWATKQSAKAAAKAAQKTAVETAKVTARASEEAARLAAKASETAAQVAAKAVQGAITVIAALLKALIAFCAAGGWILIVCIIVILIIYVLFNSAWGLLVSVDDENNWQALPTAVSELTEEYYGNAIDKIEFWREQNMVGNNEPEIIFTDYSATGDDGGELFSVENIQDIMAVFYSEILTGNRGIETVNYLTTERKARLSEIFNDMCSISVTKQKVVEVRTSVTEEEKKQGKKGKLLYKKVYISVNRKNMTAYEAADKYGFNDEEREILDELMTDSGAELISYAIGQSAYGLLSGIQINENMPTNIIGYTIVANAKRYLGRSYSSMDCSSLVRAAYTATGFDWDGTSTEMAKECVNMNCVIDRSQLQPGDLIFWQSIDTKLGKPYCGNSHCHGICTRWNMIHHVAIYIGNGQIIESATGGVQIRDIWEGGKWHIAFCARPYCGDQSGKTA